MRGLFRTDSPLRVQTSSPQPRTPIRPRPKRGVPDPRGQGRTRQQADGRVPSPDALLATAARGMRASWPGGPVRAGRGVVDCPLRESDSAATPKSAAGRCPRVPSSGERGGQHRGELRVLGGGSEQRHECQARCRTHLTTCRCPASTLQRGGDREVVVVCSPGTPYLTFPSPKLGEAK